MKQGLNCGFSTAVLIVVAASCFCFPRFAHSESSAKPVNNQVVVDVVVTDEANRPVVGLRGQDFQVFENSKKETIRSFVAHTDHVTPSAGKLDLPTNTFTNADSFPPDSINVILLDQLNTSIEDQGLARQKVIDFLAHKPPGAAFAVFTLRNDEEACHPYNLARVSFGITQSPATESDWDCPSRGTLGMVQGVTLDKDRLTAALNAGFARPRRTQLRQMPPGWLQNLDPWKLTPTLSPLPSGGWPLIFFPRRLFPSDPLPPGVSPLRFRAWPPFFPGYLFPPDSLPPAVFDHYGAGPLEVYDTSMSSLAEIGHFLQDLPGRKSLIWMSDSFDAAPIAQYIPILFPPKFKGWENTDPFSPTQMLHLTVGRLFLARVAIYPVDLNGRNTDIDVKRMCGGLQQVAGTVGFTSLTVPISTQPFGGSCDEHAFRLSYVASQTGGVVFHGEEKIQDALIQASSDGSTYYSLGYSTNSKFDGRLRKIKVRLEGKKYHLFYRERYYADDPSTLDRPETAESPDFVLPVWHGSIPWTEMRISSLNSQSDESNGPILAAMRYGAPESNDIVFSAHVEPTDKLVEATSDQMKLLQDYESFRAERVQNAMEHLTEKEKKTQHKGRTVIETLPPADPTFLQPYSVDYSLPVKQLTLTSEKDGDRALHLEVAILAYDALGKRVAGLNDTIKATITESELQRFQSSDYKLHDTIEIPDRVTLLRLAVRDVAANRTGSLEIPIWAISSPSRRKRLQLPHDGEGASSSGSTILQTTPPN